MNGFASEAFNDGMPSGRAMPHEHGGPDAGPPVSWDFSTNANAVAPPACLLEHLARADRRAYPEAGYAALREHLAARHLAGSGEAAMARIVPTAGSSEAIRRLTLAAMRCGVRQVWVPQPAYADYEQAARALGLRVRALDDSSAWLARQAASADRSPQLLWLCEPCNPTGASLSQAFWAGLRQTLAASQDKGATFIVALDRAYEPLRLSGDDPVPQDVAAQCWQLWSPNKALGLTGVRAGWVTAPAVAVSRAHHHGLNEALLANMQALAPSWVLSAEGVALLTHWQDPQTQDWLRASLAHLRILRDALMQGLTERGWQVRPSVTNFVLAEAPPALRPHLADMLAHARREGIKWRDASSFGLPGRVRLRVHHPQAQAALFAVLDEMAQWMR